MPTARDRFWLWGHLAGSHNTGWGLPATSRITQTEAAFYMDIPNLIMVSYKGEPTPPFDQHALPMKALDRVVWSIVGEAGITSSDVIVGVRDLAARQSNVVGAMMDDFFHDAKENGSLGPISPQQLVTAKADLDACGRDLDVWVVLYTHQMHLPIGPYVEPCDVLTLWTWRSEELADLEKNMRRCEEIAPNVRKVLGCYMWDYGNHAPMPVDRMERQCETGLRWLKEGRIEGMIFLASCVCDIGLEAVEWSRTWIAAVGSQPLPG